MIKEFSFFFSSLPRNSGKRSDVSIWVFSSVTREDYGFVFSVYFVLFAYCFSGTEQTSPMEETVETPEQLWKLSEAEPLSKYSQTNIFFLNAKETINSY